jgi:hypothetical protein
MAITEVGKVFASCVQQTFYGAFSFRASRGYSEFSE